MEPTAVMTASCEIVWLINYASPGSPGERRSLLERRGIAHELIELHAVVSGQHFGGLLADHN
jgi:hypothetical protein